MTGPRVVERPIAAAALAAAAALLACGLALDEPTSLDRECRRIAGAPRCRALASVLSPLYPIGLPGGYITLATALAYWLRRRGRSGGPRVVASAWAGWLGHRAIKLAYRRTRPVRAGERARSDSYPSGHTTGTTALALTAAAVLRRERVLSRAGAAALALGAPLVMGAYRVIADDHWATDVLGGWLLGAAIAASCAPRPRSVSRAPSTRRPRRRSRPEGSPSAA